MAKQCPTPAKVEEMKLKEITHCRLGMMAFAGLVAQTYLVDYSTAIGHVPL